MNRIITMLFGLGCVTQVYAFPCFLTLVKDTCWTSYNVTVVVVDASNNYPLLTVIIPTGSSWVRKEFNCTPKQKLGFQAQFNPVFWEDDKNKIYSQKEFLVLPDQIGPKETAWNVNLCYPGQFAEVPMPPEATANCQCDTSNIPPISPPQ